MSRRYLVTGAAGFIGSGVVRRLLDAGHQVIGLDNLNSAYDTRLKAWRLEQLQRMSAFQFRQCDIEHFEGLRDVFGGAHSFDAVINLAARAGVRPSTIDPWIYFQTNATGTLNLLEHCRRTGIKKFILASTSSLYGGHNPIPFSEDTDTNRPLSPYAASKKAAEAIAYTYHHLYGIDITVPRYFTVYGPAGRPDMSVFRFVQLIAEGEPIVVFGDGRQQRDFTYVDDIAAGTVAALEPLGYEVINLGGDRPVELNYVIDTIATLLGKKPQIDRRPPHPADVPATWANVEKANRLLGWRPIISIEEGLRRAVEWYRENRALAAQISLGEA